jgi:hypothetical protein
MSIGTDYEDAVRRGDTKVANYLAQMLASQAGININTNQVTAAPASMLPSLGYGSAPSVSLDIPQGYFSGGDNSNQKSFFQGLMDFPLLPGGPSPNDIGGGVKAVGDTVGGIGRLLAIVTDIPRMITLILGVALIIIGLLMLNNKTIVQAVRAAAA